MSGIIVGIDGSAHSQQALEWAVREAAVRQVPLTVLTVFRTPVSFWGGPVSYPEADATDIGKARADAQEALAKAMAAVADARPEEVRVLAQAGLPAEVLISQSADADMLVVGSRGAGGFSRLLLGSVSTQVTHHAHCPVVIIPSADRHA
jgi:nucleotide-binding universal stress UspA family protein